MASTEDESGSSSTTTTTTTTPWQTVVRQHVTPFLPPPVTRAVVQHLDPVLEPYMGPDATIALVATSVVAWLLLWILTRAAMRFGSGSSALQDDDDNKRGGGVQASDYDATTLLVGPVNAGKTRLFYQAVTTANNDPPNNNGEANDTAAKETSAVDPAYANFPTIQSLKANVAVVRRVRYLDWPGYASVQDSVLQPILLDGQRSGSSSSRLRLVVVVDATQPCSAAADVLYPLLQQLSSSRKKNHKNKAVTIVVACHKKDFPKAKNERRIKIQLRTELERLLLTQNSDSNNENDDSATTTTPFWPPGEPLDLDALSFCQLHFMASTCEGRGTPALLDYCRTGTLPSVTLPKNAAVAS